MRAGAARAGGPGCGERARGRCAGPGGGRTRLHGVLQHPERGAARRELGEDGGAERPVGAPHLQLARLPPPRAGQRRRVRDRGGAVERERGLLAEERGDADHEGERVQPLARRLVERHLQVEAQRVGLAVAVVVLLPRPQLARAQRGAERVVERARRRPAHFDGNGLLARDGRRLEAIRLDERLVPEPHERLLARRHLLRPQPARRERDDERQHDRRAPVDEHAARAARAPVRAVLDDERPLEDHRHRWRNSKPLGATAVGSSLFAALAPFPSSANPDTCTPLRTCSPPMLVMSGGNLGVDDPSAIIVTRGITALAMEPSIADEACSAESNLVSL